MNYSKVLSAIVTLTAFAAGAAAQQLQQAPLTLPKNTAPANVTVLNMWYGNEDHPSLSMELK